MSEIDWSKAPPDAEYWCEMQFFKTVNGEWKVWCPGVGSWVEPAYKAPDNFSWWGNAVERPSPAWGGEGLPPVGAVCEVKLQEEWHLCEVIGHFQQPQAMVAAFTVGQFHGGKKLDSKIAECFRPIRTPEQIAVDEREAAITEIEELIAGYSYRHCAEQVYKAGYRKQEKTE